MAKVEKTVWVCASCLTASCWHGEFMCDQAYTSDIKRMKVSELRKLNREHPHHYSPANLLKIYGKEAP